MQVISNLADDAITDEKLAEFDALETELKNVQAHTARTADLRQRNQAYNRVVVPAGVPSPRTPDSRDRSDLEKAFANYLRTGVPNADISGLQVTNAQGEGVSTAGGYLVPTSMRDKIIERMVSFGGLGNEVETINTDTGNPLDMITLDDTANVGGIAAEHAPPASGADLVFGKKSLGAYRYTSAGAGSNLPLRVSTALIRDSAFDIEGLVARKLGERIFRAQAPHWVTGTGVGEPQGLLSLTHDLDLDTADTPDYQDLVDTQDELDAAYEQNAKWLMRKNTWSQLRLIVDLNGRPIIQDSTDGISEKPRRRLLGHDVIIDEAAPALSAAGITNPIAFGDFREAYVRRFVGGVSVLVNPYTRQANGEIEYTGEMYADGMVQERNAYVILRNNT
jgi:HK97 family phage major capsid protein